MEKKENQNYYHCYSPMQKKFLVEMGFKIREERINKVNEKKFWIFKISKSLSVTLKAWSTMKKLTNK